ncbi:MAG: AI-2E family transporter [Eubacterium sp.]|nr:AI-2E family transporter [Eubacterium sp.]
MKEEKRYVKRLKMITSNIWYIVAIVALCTAAIMLIVNWSATTQALGKAFRVLMPFILGFLFAYLINPLVRLFEKLFNHIAKDKGLSVKKVFAMLISYLIVLGAITVIIVFIAPQIVTSVNQLGQTVQKGYDYVRLHPTSFLDWIPFVNTADVMEKLKDNINGIAINMGSKVFPYLYSTFTSTFVIAYDIFFGLVISIYLTWEKDALVRGFHRLVQAFVPKKYAEKTWEKLLKCNHIFNGFLVGKAIDSLIIGLITFVAMVILDFPYPVLLSVIVCITNMIPYFGPIIGAIPGCAIYLFIDPMLAVWFALLILAVQQFDGWILGPWILGDQTGIKPLTVILGITVGGAYFGVMGMFLGVPTVAVLQYLGGEFVKNRFKKKNMKDPLENDEKPPTPIDGSLEEN